MSHDFWEITPGQETIEAYAIRDRVDELEAALEVGNPDSETRQHYEAELAALRGLREEISANSGNADAAILINAVNFEAYMEQDAKSLYKVPDELDRYIDWAAYASDRETDYNDVVFEGTTYKLRA